MRPPRKLAAKAGAAPAASPKRRCAIYTRKSSEEGLEQEFNSLHAQREACEAFIRSQRHEGWTLLPQAYDDGGISGGTLERPALLQLLADIQAGKVDLVVVYKVDRLTRSLADFAKIVEVFDAQGASFVSVTQQFNTTTSMGRLTLNMLLSFAQFEREVTGERIRDKIAASKAKGMWMGGVAPLGYDVKDRKLIINDAEANTVRHIFRRYLALGSVHLLRDELADAGIRSKLRPQMQNPKQRGGQNFSRGALYTLLQNRLYRGEIAHQGQVYPGEHTAIVAPELWDAAQAQLQTNRAERRTRARADSASLLTGLLTDSDGHRLTPTHATKNGRRYRYYVSQAAQQGERSSAPTLRIPAADLERAVSNRIQQLLSQPADILKIIASFIDDGEAQRRCLTRAEQMAQDWNELPPSTSRQHLITLLSRVDVQPDRIDLRLKPLGLIALLGGDPAIATGHADDVVFSLPATLQRTGMEMRLIVAGIADLREPDPTLIRLIARAARLHERLIQTGASMSELAEADGASPSYVVRVLRLAYLAPDIVTAILAGKQPLSLTAEKLIRDSRLPLAWEEQRRQLGFA
jgi:site-specific DNA recombinase